MFVLCVNVYVVPGKSEGFLEATLKNARGSRTEPGNLRFDVLQSNEDENRFFFYEVYKSEDAFKTHQQTEHYLTWRETVNDWMEKKREGHRYANCYPTDEEWT